MTAQARRWGWSALTIYASVGAMLEAANGFKIAPYLDDELGRSLLRLGHAHGVGLALVMLAFAAVGAPHVNPASAPSIFRGLAFALVAIPIGFATSAFAHPEGDPGWPIFLVPIGALSLIVSLARIAWAARTR